MAEAQVLLTRPIEKSQQLADSLSLKGITSCIQPMLKLEALEVNEQQLSMLDSADIVVFVSQDAVRYLHKIRPELAENSRCYAVGKSTAETVETLFGKQCASPLVETSEGLLASPDLNKVADQQVVLVKGKGGRAKIAKELKARGAILQPLSVYQRYTHPELSSAMVKEWQKQAIDAVVLTSNTSIDSFLALVDDKSWLRGLTLFVVSERCVNYLASKNLEVKQIINCQGADNKSILDTIAPYYQKQQSNAMEQEKDITADSTVSDKPVSATQQTVPPVEQKSSSGKGVAWLALLVSLASAGTLGFGYTLYLKQQETLTTLTQEREALNQQVANAEQKAASVISQNQNLQRQLSQQIADAELALNEQINSQLVKAQQIEPKLNQEEVKSLYRMAEFKAHVQQDYLGAASMLLRIDTLLQSFSGTQQVRTALHNDIQALQAIKPVDIEGTYLKLNGLIANLADLSLNMVELPDEADKVEQEALSNNVNDWQVNLKRSWHLLVDDFIKVRKRTAAIEPLLTQEEQALIRHQLRFYLVQAQTALVEQQASVFAAALSQANNVLTTYYDTQQTNVTYLRDQLSSLSATEINFKPEVHFSSEQAIKELL